MEDKRKGSDRPVIILVKGKKPVGEEADREKRAVAEKETRDQQEWKKQGKKKRRI